MKRPLAALSLILLLGAVTGCRHRTKVVSFPPPPPTPVPEHVSIPHATLADMPEIPPPAPPQVVLGGAVVPVPSKRVWQSPRPEQPAQDAQTSQPEAATSATAGEEPPATTPIGELSAAPNTQGLPSSTTIASEIQSIQRQLNGIRRALSPAEQRTASQIRTFLAKATNALQAGDLDGANTLTVKARVLLSELQ